MKIFKNGRIVLNDSILDGHYLCVNDGKIVDIYSEENKYDGEVIDAAGLFVSPGFVDIHVHGGAGHYFSCNDSEKIAEIFRIHTKHGTTSMFPSTTAAPVDEIIETCAVLDEFVGKRNGFCDVCGIHLEGPFLNQTQRGAQPAEYIINPTENNYERLLNASENIRHVTYAPELPGGIDFARELNARGITGAIGHSDATLDVVEQAARYGTTHVTHLYSGMNTVHRKNAYRHIGLVECAYLLDYITVELIADSKHMPIELLRLIHKIKGDDKIAVVTDAIFAGGLDESENKTAARSSLGNVIIRDGVAFVEDGSCFAGSIATADKLVRNMMKAGATLPAAVKMASHNPAVITKIDKSKGSLQPGKDADIIMFDVNINVKLVMIRGDMFND